MVVGDIDYMYGIKLKVAGGALKGGRTELTIELMQNVAQTRWRLNKFRM